MAVHIYLANYSERHFLAAAILIPIGSYINFNDIEALKWYELILLCVVTQNAIALGVANFLHALSFKFTCGTASSALLGYQLLCPTQ